MYRNQSYFSHEEFQNILKRMHLEPSKNLSTKYRLSRMNATSEKFGVDEREGYV
jgi:hypothetical protein